MKEPRSFQQKVSPKGKAKKIVGPAGAKKTKRRSPPGGKALARLHFFEQQRGLRETDTRSDKPTQLKDAKDDDGHRLASSRSEALARISLMPAVPVAQGWRPIGPFSIPHGQTYGSGPGSRPSISGRISAIAVDPANANHILIGAAGGGVWETRNLGATWAPRTDNQASLATGAIAFTPSNSSIVYAGTGEGNFFSWLGAGLLRSTDGGATWTSRATAPFVGLGFYSIIVDPLDANHLLAATSGGLFESSDAGATWTSRRTQMTWDISMHPAVAGDPNSTKEIIAASTGGVFRSTDGGTTWSAVNLPSAPTSFSRIAVCHSPSDGSVAYVFAASGATAY